MSESGFNDSSTQSTEDHGIPTKRQKFDTVNSLKLDLPDNHSSRASEWEKSCIMKQLTTHRTRLSDTEASATQIRKMRAEMEEAIVEKEEMLSIQARVDREMIKYLEARLEAVKRTQEVGERQSTLEAEESTIKSKIREKMDSLFTKNPILPNHSMSSNSETTPTSSKAEEWMEIKLEEIFKENIETQESDLQSTQLEEVNIQTQEPASVSSGQVIWERTKAVLAARANELKEQLQSANSMISNLRQVVKEKSLPEGAGAVEQPVVHDKSEALSSKIYHNETRGSSPAASKPGTSCLQQREGTSRKETENQSSLLHDQPKALGRSPRTPVGSKEMKRDMMKKTEEFNSAAVKNQSSLDARGNDSQTQGNTKPSSSRHVNDRDEAQQNLHLTVHGFQISVSHPKFFTIQWSKYYEQITGCIFACTKCSEQRTSKIYIEDHLWVNHFGGSFVCPRCPVQSNSLFSRRNVQKHMEQYHSNKFLCNPRVNDRQMKQRRSVMMENAEESGSQGVKHKSSSDASDKKVSKEPDGNQSSSGCPSRDNCKLKCGNYHLLVSNPKFFTLQWDEYYQRINYRTYSCRKCSQIKSSTSNITDHVWTQHCGENFLCFYCTDPLQFFTWRSTLSSHMRRYHPDECIKK